MRGGGNNFVSCIHLEKDTGLAIGLHIFAT